MKLFKKWKKEKSSENSEDKKKKHASCCDFKIEEIETHFDKQQISKKE